MSLILASFLNLSHIDLYQIQAKYLKNAIKFIIFKGKKEPEHISHSNSFQRQPTNPYGILALYSPPVPQAF